MGLDNTIKIKLKKGEHPPFVDEEGDVCYWRKCWGVRGAILKVLDPEGFKQKKGTIRYPVDAEDIPAIIRALRPFFNEKYWENYAQSIWTFEEMFETLVNQVVNLKMLYEYMKTHEVECTFIDSY